MKFILALSTIFCIVGLTCGVKSKNEAVKCIAKLEKALAKIRIPDGIQTLHQEIVNNFPEQNLIKIEDQSVAALNLDYPLDCDGFTDSVATAVLKVKCFNPKKNDSKLEEKLALLDEAVSENPLASKIIGLSGICGLLLDHKQLREARGVNQ